jgi:hypothetical protein
VTTYEAGVCNIGVPMSEFFLGRNGWNIPTHNCEF